MLDTAGGPAAGKHLDDHPAGAARAVAGRLPAPGDDAAAVVRPVRRPAAVVAEGQLIRHRRRVTAMSLRPGLRGVVEAVVGRADTAPALGSGEVAVLGTPRVLALLEAATVRAVAGHLAPGSTTVGTRVELDHRAPTRVGVTVRAEAELSSVSGTRLTFDVALRAGETLAARGRIVRVVVDAASFDR